MHIPVVHALLAIAIRFVLPAPPPALWAAAIRGMLPALLMARGADAGFRVRPTPLVNIHNPHIRPLAFRLY